MSDKMKIIGFQKGKIPWNTGKTFPPLILSITGNKKCPRCEQIKHITSFNIVRYYRRNNELRSCRRTICKECRNKQSRIRQFKKNHGISVEERDKIIYLQKGLCAICKIKLKGGQFNHLDHDHSTGEIRGVLCHLCNTSLGHFGDNLDGIMRVVKYLKKSEGSTPP